MYNTLNNRIILGCEEWCSLPDLGLPAIRVKIDSGAKTSVVHAFNVHIYKDNGIEYVKFYIHPIQNNRKIVKECIASLVGRRLVKSSNGGMEKRLSILTNIKLGDHTWQIELTLTNRDAMGYRMLLGREAMRHHVLVDPNKMCAISSISVENAIALYVKKQPPTPKRDPLNIVVLASDLNLYSNRRIMEAGNKLGHNMQFVNVNSCYISVKSNSPAIFHLNGVELRNIDVVIPRLRPSVTSYGCALVRQFQVLGAFCLNSANAIMDARDKLKSLQILAERGLSVPATGFASCPSNVKHLVEIANGVPLVIKLLKGTHGNGVMLAESQTAAKSVITAFRTINADIMIQEFIRESRGKDIRCFVINGKVAGSMQREALQGDFRANLHLGGNASKILLTKQEKKIAISAAKALGLKVAGVDLVRSNDGPKILEVNASPGLTGIEKTTGKDVAEMMIECVEWYVYGEHKLRYHKPEPNTISSKQLCEIELLSTSHQSPDSTTLAPN